MADELARCLVDARNCAEVGEELLEAVRDAADPDVRRTAREALIAPVAVSRVLVDLIEHPPELAFAAARLLADTADAGATRLAALDGEVGARAAIDALRRAAGSARRLVAAAA